MSVQAKNNSAQTSQVRQLAERQRKELVTTAQIANTIVSIMALNAFIEFILGDELDNLRENIFSLMHR